MSRPRRRRARGRLARTALACGATVAALGAAEFVYRAVLDVRKGPTTNPKIVRADPRLGWSHRPGAAARHRSDEFDVSIAIDAAGRRAAHGGEGPEGAPLVLCVGDSFTFGWGVEEPETFAARLRDRLAARVVNDGVSGYGTDQQWLKLEAEGLGTAPRLVIATHCRNDVDEVLRDEVYGMAKPRFELRDGVLHLADVPGPQGWLRRRSRLFAAARRHVVEWLRPATTPADREAGRELVRRLYAEMADAVRARGGSLLVVAWSADWLGADLGAAAFVDVGPALTRAGRDAPVTFAVDGHWNAWGHATVAEAIAAHVEAHGLLRR